MEKSKMKIKAAIANKINYWVWEDTALTLIYIIIIIMLSLSGICIFKDHSIQNYYMHTSYNDTCITYAVYGERYYHEDTKAFISTNHVETVNMLHMLQETLK